MRRRSEGTQVMYTCVQTMYKKRCEGEEWRSEGTQVMYTCVQTVCTIKKRSEGGGVEE